MFFPRKTKGLFSILKWLFGVHCARLVVPTPPHHTKLLFICDFAEITVVFAVGQCVPLIVGHKFRQLGAKYNLCAGFRV